jgi:hypothetical protein
MNVERGVSSGTKRSSDSILNRVVTSRRIVASTRASIAMDHEEVCDARARSGARSNAWEGRKVGRCVGCVGAMTR